MAPTDKDGWLRQHWVGALGVAVAFCCLLVSALWFYLQLLQWKKHGDDYMLTVANIVVTCVLWVLLLGAVIYFWRMGRRSRSGQNELAALCEERRLQIAASERQQNFELARAEESRNLANAEARAARDELATAQNRIAELEAQLADAQKQIPPHPEELPILLEPTKGPSPKQFLIVTNKGARQKFHAQCTVFDSAAKTIRTTYDLGWDERQSREISLAHEESQKLLIARAWDDRGDDLDYICLCKLGDEEVLWDRWNKGEESNISYSVEIKLFGEQAVRSQQFIVRPGGRGKSAIEMYEV